MASDGSGSDQRGLRPMEGTIGQFSDDYGTVLDLIRLCPKPHSHSGEKQEKRKFTDVFRSALIGFLIRWSWVRVPAASLGFILAVSSAGLPLNFHGRWNTRMG